MHLNLAIQTVFAQLCTTLTLLSHSQYVEPSKGLSLATIGQHTRHIIEMFQCLLIGYQSGVVNYENRNRDFQIETDKLFAIELLQDIFKSLSRENKSLILEAGYREDSEELLRIETNFFREIAYNLEHAIHHMALIKVGLLELSDIAIPDGFGVASSTLKYKKACAQ
jgi:hypothetical protein